MRERELERERASLREREREREREAGKEGYMSTKQRFDRKKNKQRKKYTLERLTKSSSSQ